MVIPLNYFAVGSGPPALQANFENSVTGYTSSPMQALFVRWALVRVRLLPPILGGALGEGA